jgi:CRISPR-associated protein Csx17
VDRGIDRFVRYSLLKRRGDSYVALPAGTFPTGYRSNADLIRRFMTLLDRFTDTPKGAEDLRRNVEGAVYQALLTTEHRGEMRDVMSAFGRMVRRAATTAEPHLPRRALKAADWLQACGFENSPSVRIAAAVASIYDRQTGAITENLCRGERAFAWDGIDLSDRMASVLGRRIQSANAAEARRNPLGGSCELNPGDVTLFIEGSVDDVLVEDLIFAFLVFDWQGYEAPRYFSAEVLPSYAVVKCLFLPSEIRRGEDPKFLVADRRILAALSAGSIGDATEMAVNRLRISGLRPLGVTYAGGVDPRRLAASLLIPVRQGRLLTSGIFHELEESAARA